MFLVMKNSLKKLLISNYTINSYYGGFGNNLQQLALGSMYAELYKNNFYSKKHKLVNTFSIINNNVSDFFAKYRFDSRFYNFDNISEKFTNRPITDTPLKNKDAKYYNENFYKIFQEIIEPNLNFKKDLEIDDQTLVMHIRSGDIFEKTEDNTILGHDYYLQNPLIYFQNLIEKYEKTILVATKPFNNPVIEILSKDKRVTLKSSTIAEDFNILLNAKNLATSGVGTFSIAAALASKNLKNLYYSNLFFFHHLNPTMVKKVIHHKYSFTNYFKIGDEWKGTKDQVVRMLSTDIKIIKD